MIVFEKCLPLSAQEAQRRLRDFRHAASFVFCYKAGFFSIICQRTAFMPLRKSIKQHLPQVLGSDAQRLIFRWNR